MKEPFDKLRRNECHRLEIDDIHSRDYISGLLLSKRKHYTQTYIHTHTHNMHNCTVINGEKVTRLWHRPCNSINDVIFALRVTPKAKTHFGCKLTIKVTKHRDTPTGKVLQDQRTTLSSEWGVPSKGE